MAYSAYPIVGGPGPRSARRVTFGRIFKDGSFSFGSLPGGMRGHGAIARDPGNTGNIDNLRCGTLMGIATSGTYDNYAGCSIIGILTQAEVSTATSVTISAAQATELVRRVGSTGTIRFVGPPTANGTVATFTETYSAVNTTSGVVTTSALDAALVAGSFLCANDGTYLPKSFIFSPSDGQRVTDTTGSDSLFELPQFPIAGIIESAKILPVWPTDTSLQAWIVAALNGAGGGQFIFDHIYQ